MVWSHDRSLGLQAAGLLPQAWAWAVCTAVAALAACGPSAGSAPKQGAQYEMPAVSGRTVVLRLKAAGSGEGTSGAAGTTQGPSASNSKTGETAWVCIRDFPASEGKCEVQWALEGKSSAGKRAAGTCSSKNVGGKVTQDTEVVLSCKGASASEPCLPRAGSSSATSSSAADSIRFKVTDAIGSFDTKAISLMKGDADTYLWTFAPSTECREAVERANRWHQDLAPKLVNEKCKIPDAVRSVLSAKSSGQTQQQTSASAPLLALSGSGKMPPRSSCFDGASSARAACLVSSSAMEIYELRDGAAELGAVKRGERLPKLCVYKAPIPEGNGNRPLHHVIGNIESGVQVAYAWSGSLEMSSGAIRYTFSGFERATGQPFFGRFLEMGTLYPLGEPDAASGVWAMDLGKAVRFVPPQWCAQNYLGVELKTSEREPTTGTQTAPGTPDSPGRPSNSDNPPSENPCE